VPVEKLPSPVLFPEDVPAYDLAMARPSDAFPIWMVLRPSQIRASAAEKALLVRREPGTWSISWLWSTIMRSAASGRRRPGLRWHDGRVIAFARIVLLLLADLVGLGAAFDQTQTVD
jgi:hypothetical protein